MSDARKTKKQLIEELAALRQEAAAVEWALRKERIMRRLLCQAAGVTASANLETVLEEVRTALEELGVPFEGCGVNVVDATTKPSAVRFHAMMAGEHWQEMQSGNPGAELVVRIWRDQKVVYRSDLEAADAHGEGDRIRWRKPVRAVLDVPFAHGTLAINSTRPDPFTAAHIEVVEEMGQVLSVALTQEGQGQGRRRGAMARLQGEMWSMSTPDDLDRLIAAIAEELGILGVPYRSCAVNIIDAAQDPTRLWGYHVTGREVSQWHGVLPEDGAATIERLQRLGVPSYRRDLWASDSYGEGARTTEVYGHPVRSVVDVPFAHGTLAVNSPEAAAFSERHIEILQDMAQVLSEGFRRQEELRVLEQHTRELEERDRLLDAFHRVGVLAQQTLSAREMLSELSRLVVEAGLFRSLAASIVDRERNCIEEVAAWWGGETADGGGPITALSQRALDGPDVLARVVRGARLEVIEGWSEEMLTLSDTDTLDSYADKVSYFMPVARGGAVLAVLATASTRAEKAQMLGRLEAMRPLVDHVAIALEHAQLYEALQREAAERKEAVETTAVALALQRVRNRVLMMDTEEGWDQVAVSVYEELAGLVACNACSINLVDLEAGRMTSHAMGSKKGLARNIREPVPDAVVQAVVSGRPVYRRTRRDPLFASSPAALPGVNSVLDVPFEGGTLAVNGPREDAFTERDMGIFEQFGQVMSEAGHRLGEIVDRNRMAQEIIHLERMRVSGELAAGVSHNLNNLLTAVLAPAQILLRKSDDPVVRREAETILTAGRRAQDLVSRLNQAVRIAHEATLGPVSLNEQVAGAIRMAQPRWRDEPEARGVRIEVVTELGEIPDIRGNATELGDAVLNLVLNAVEAMPNGGTLAIRTQALGGGAQLSVSDTGTGMDAETRRRVFEPFFTTKRDVGSGLGLSTVHGMVTRWGGTIEVDSSPGNGATFALWLPVWGEAPVLAAAPATATAAARGARLLVVEDDEEVCGVLERLLSGTHAVEVVRDGQEALDLFVPGRYDVALIDLGLPGLAGDQLAERVRALDRSVATVLITGWVLEPDDARLRWFDLQIPKPFADLNEVESVVAQAIGLHDSRG